MQTTTFLTLAPDGAWTWFNDTRALWHNGYLFFGYVKRLTSRSALAVFDPATGHCRELFELDFGTLDRDDHNNPAIVALPDGRLLVSAATHDRSNIFVSCRSRTAMPLNPHDWEEQRITPGPESTTYQNLHVLSAEKGRLYNFTRSIAWNPTLYYSDDQATTWRGPTHFIKASGRRRPYVKYASNGTDRIDVLYTDGHPHAIKENSIYHFYIRDGALWTSDGKELSADLSLDTDKGVNGTPIFRYGFPASEGAPLFIPNARGWVWDMAYDPEGNPIVLFQIQASDESDWKKCRIYYLYARWIPGQGWRRTWIAHGGRPLYDAELHYGGGLAIDPLNPRVVYISTNAERPFSLAEIDMPLNAKERYELYRGVSSDGGETFRWEPLTVDSPMDHLRPYVPRGDSKHALLCVRGDYRHYTDFRTEIAGCFSLHPPS